jgi:hypothetical protein
MYGAATGAAFGWVGGMKLNDPWAAVAAHAAVGCASAAASGGNCGQGALAAGFNSAAMQYMPASIQGNRAYQLTYVSIVGGTASVLGGGKFANGATTAAFGYLYSVVRSSSTFSVGEKRFIIIGGTWADQSQVEGDLRGIFSTSRGAEMLSTLEARRFLGIFSTPFTVDLTVVGTAYTYMYVDTIYVDPKFHPYINTTAGYIPANTQRIMAHELGHAVFGTPDLGLKNVILNENAVMNALGHPSRIEY